MLKRLLALLCAMMLLTCCAFAEEEIEYDDTLAETLGISGDFDVLDEFGLMYFVPETMTEQELTTEEKADGKLARYSSDAFGMSIALTLASDENGEDVEDADVEAALLEADGIDEVLLQTINGLPAVSYCVEETDEAVTMFLIGEGYGLTFSFTGADETDSDVIGLIINSIMSVA